MFQPKVLKFNGGYFTYDFEQHCINLSEKFEDAFIFTTSSNYSCIYWQLEHYMSGYPNGFNSKEEENKWKNPQWINVYVGIKF